MKDKSFIINKFLRSRFTSGFTIFAVILLSTLIFAIGQACSASKPLLTLDKALELGNENNPVISATYKKVTQYEERLNQAKAGQYPSIVARMAYQQTGEEPKLPVYDATPGNTETPYYAKNGFRETWKAALEMSWLVYSGGTVKYNVQAKELALDSVKAEAQRTFQGVENSIYTAWYELQRAKARLEVAKEALELAKAHLRRVVLFYENGVVAKNQVLRAKVEVSDSELKRIKATNAVNVAWSALERAIGVSVKERFTLPETGKSIEDINIPEDPESIALKNRPELTALEKSRLSALAMSRSATGAGGPQVALKAEAFKVDDEFFPDMQDDWRISIAAEWELFDGGESSAKAGEAKAAAEEVLYKIEDLEKQISLEISTAIMNLQSSIKRVSVAEKQVTSAEEDYRMEMKRYQAQVGTNIDVLDSRVALVNARNQLADSVYDAHRAHADLLYAMGRKPGLSGSDWN